ncbi:MULTISPECIES: WhiB family transcriptional regulator [unclassified Nocardiopsis]|uniref:WhiB family transcriptional regulator n=1 Tax=Nocardiopsis TaxID=2013 RepID=UPI00387A913F
MRENPAALCRTRPALFEDPSQKARRRALAVCGQCPLADACLEAALSDPDGTRYRVAGGCTPTQRAHIAAVRERAELRARSPRLAAAYRDLWEGRIAESADPDRKAAARHLLQDQRAARSLGEPRMVSEAARVAGEELRLMVAAADRDGIGQVLAGLPSEHRGALLVAFAVRIVDMAGTGWGR